MERRMKKVIRTDEELNKVMRNEKDEKGTDNECLCDDSRKKKIMRSNEQLNQMARDIKKNAQISFLSKDVN